jgi:Sulfotransferase family
MVGCPRSGTTLVQSVLAAHPQVHTFKESHFFDKGFRPRWFGNYRLNALELQSYFQNFLSENSIGNEQERAAWLAELAAQPNAMPAAQWLISFLDAQTIAAGRSLWMEKTPDHVWRIPLLEQVCPDARFIHIVRAPLPTVASLHRASDSWGTPRPWLHCLLHWRVSLSYSLKYCQAPRHHFVFYDDFVAAPQTETVRLLQWLNLDHSDDLLTRRREESGAIIGEQESWKQNTLGEIAPKATAEKITAPWYIELYTRWARAYQNLYERVRRSRNALA